MFKGICGAKGSRAVTEFSCSFTGNVVSLTCSFDGGEAEACSNPLVLRIERFGVGEHNVVLTATNDLGERYIDRLHFSFSGNVLLKL